MWGSVVVAGICPPLPPSFTAQSLTVMMKHDHISKLTMLAVSRQTEPKFQHIVPTFTNDISRIIQATVKINYTRS